MPIVSYSTGKRMRKREEILNDSKRKEDLLIELLLDIRDILTKEDKPIEKKAVGRPKKNK